MKRFQPRVETSFTNSSRCSFQLNTSSQMGVSKNNGTPKSSILIGFSIINHPFWGTPIFGNIQIASTFPKIKRVFHQLSVILLSGSVVDVFHHQTSMSLQEPSNYNPPVRNIPQISSISDPNLKQPAKFQIPNNQKYHKIWIQLQKNKPYIYIYTSFSAKSKYLFLNFNQPTTNHLTFTITWLPSQGRRGAKDLRPSGTSDSLAPSSSRLGPSWMDLTVTKERCNGVGIHVIMGI